MSNAEEQLRILKNMIMSDDYVTQEELKKIVKAMEEKNKGKEIETR